MNQDSMYDEVIHDGVKIRAGSLSTLDPTTQDPYGSYIIVQGNISSQKLNLRNIYGPNDDNP